MSTAHTLDLPWSKPPLTHNQRLHWATRHRAVRNVRETARLVAWAAKLGGPHQHITVRLHWAPGDNRRRDAPNLTATSKPAIDGLVDAGLVPDDHDGHVTEQMPAIHRGKGPASMWLEVSIDD